MPNNSASHTDCGYSIVVRHVRTGKLLATLEREEHVRKANTARQAVSSSSLGSNTVGVAASYVRGIAAVDAAATAFLILRMK